MIIAISGKINSGKDTIGQIIKIILDSPHLNNEGILNFMRKEIYNNEKSPYYSSWEIKKFADKLKDIVCLLLGCTREQLEDREFKEKELGEEWWYWKIYGELVNYQDRKIEEFTSKLPIPELIKPTPRLLLQLLGTEAGRQIIHPNIWVNALMSEYKPIDCNCNGPGFCGSPGNCEELAIYPNWIITDMRFPNELKAVKDREGITIRINREPEDVCNCGNSTEWVYTTISEGSKKICRKCNAYLDKKIEHESETALDNAEFNYVIDNNKDILHLISEVRKILEKT